MTAPSLLVLGVGMGACFSTIFEVALGDVTHEEAGSASGSLSAVQQLAAALGSALVTTVYFGLLRQDGGTRAMTVSVGVVAAVVVGCLGLVWLMPQRRRRTPSPGEGPWMAWRSWAGVSTWGMWPVSVSSSNRAFGMAAAKARPYSGSTIRSLSPHTTRVGTVTSWRRPSRLGSDIAGAGVSGERGPVARGDGPARRGAVLAGSIRNGAGLWKLSSKT